MAGWLGGMVTLLVNWHSWIAGWLGGMVTLPVNWHGWITGWSVGRVTLLGFGTVDCWLLRQAQHHLGGDAFLSG